MVAVYDAGGVFVSRFDFKTFLEQYLRGPTLDLVSRLTEDWNQRVGNAAGMSIRSIALPATRTALAGLYADAHRRSGVYAMYVKHPSQSPTVWICFYVGISGKDARGRIVQHHGRDVEANYRRWFGFLGECSDVLTCYATIEGPATPKGQLELLEHCLTANLRPWFLALAVGVGPLATPVMAE